MDEHLLYKICRYINDKNTTHNQNLCIRHSNIIIKTDKGLYIINPLSDKKTESQILQDFAEINLLDKLL